MGVILEEIFRTLITCVSSHHSPAEMRTKQGKRSRAIRAACSIEAKLPFDLQPDKINYSFVDSEGHSRCDCYLDT